MVRSVIESSVKGVQKYKRSVKGVRKSDKFAKEILIKSIMKLNILIVLLVFGISGADPDEDIPHNE